MGRLCRQGEATVDILVIMCAGAVVGRLFVPASVKRVNELFQTCCTALLIFAMGISLGAQDDFLSNLGVFGAQSLVFCLLPTVCSVILVYLLTNWLMGDGKPDPSVGAHPGTTGGIARRIRAVVHEEGFAIMAFIALALGILSGLAAPSFAPFALLSDHSTLVLWLLMFSVGISVGLRRGLISSIREHHVKTLVIPFGVVVGSIAGGALAAVALGCGLREGMGVASGLGWYSLAGVTIEGMAGAQLGAIAFLSSLMRELISFFCIPWIARHLNYYACIAAGAATSEDTTLPMMIRYTDERTVVFSLVNGIICSTCVPFLLALFFG